MTNIREVVGKIRGEARDKHRYGRLLGVLWSLDILESKDLCGVSLRWLEREPGVGAKTMQTLMEVLPALGLDVDEGLIVRKADKAAQGVIGAIVDAIDSNAHFMRMLDGMVSEYGWSEDVIDALWFELSERPAAKSYLLYLFRAALRAGDVKPFLDVYCRDDVDQGEPDEYEVALSEGSGDAEEGTVHAMISGRFTMQGKTWASVVSFSVDE
jgi:hypothetical protein